MSLSAPELKTVREHLCQARELVETAFGTTRVAGISTLARDLRHIRNSLEDALADLADMQAALEKQPPLTGGGDELAIPPRRRLRRYTPLLPPPRPKREGKAALSR